MTKEELREKRNLVIENLNHVIAILGSDELYIDELEKENLYYKDIVETNSAEWEEQGRRVVALEKENAELKDYRLTTLAKQQTENQKYTVNLEHKLSWYDDQLTKTKELLRMVIDSYNHKERFSFEKDLMKAELFLNSKEEKEMTENSNVPECPSIKIGCGKMYYVDEVEK